MSNANNRPISVPQHIEIEHITPSTNTGETNPPENSTSPPTEPYINNTTIIDTNTQTQTAKTINALKTVIGTPTNATRYGLRANPATTTYQEFLTHELSKKPALAWHLLKKSNQLREPRFQLDGTLIDHDDDGLLESSLASSRHLSPKITIISAFNIMLDHKFTFKETASLPSRFILIVQKLNPTSYRLTFFRELHYFYFPASTPINANSYTPINDFTYLYPFDMVLILPHIHLMRQ